MFLLPNFYFNRTITIFYEHPQFPTKRIEHRHQVPPLASHNERVEMLQKPVSQDVITRLLLFEVLPLARSRLSATKIDIQMYDNYKVISFLTEQYKIETNGGLYIR